MGMSVLQVIVNQQKANLVMHDPLTLHLVPPSGPNFEPQTSSLHFWGHPWVDWWTNRLKKGILTEPCRYFGK